MGRTVVAPRAPAPHFELSVKQLRALSSEADITIMGGGNFGGKSFALRSLPLLPEYLGTNGCQTVLFAESNRKLEMAGGMVDACKKMYAPLHPLGIGGYKQTPEKRWTWPTGSTIGLSYLGEPGQWDAMEAAVIGIDQAEQISWEQFDSITGRNRTSCGVRTRTFLTVNPPEEGKEHWITKLLGAGGWIDEDGDAVPEMDGVVRWYVLDNDSFIFADTIDELRQGGMLIKDRQGKEILPKSLTFVQALVDDHPDVEAREREKRTLASKGEVERARRLYGNWHATEEAGKYFRKEFFPVLLEYEPPTFVRRVRAWDCAWSESDSADWTPGVLMDQGDDHFVTITDLIRFRGTQAHVERCIKLIADLDGPGVWIRLPKDAGLAGFAQSQLARWLAAHGYNVILTADKGDKLTRSKPYQGRAERREIRMAKSHPSAGVAEMMTKPFDVFDSEGKRITIPGIPVSNISTLKEWHPSFLQDHVLFGRNTVQNRKKKKDVVDAAVGGNDVLTSDPADPADVDDEQIQREFEQARAALGGGHSGGGMGFGGGSVGGSRWL